MSRCECGCLPSTSFTPRFNPTSAPINACPDFSIKPGTPNAYRLIGAEANAIAPGKRPLSSCTPTFVESDRGVMVANTLAPAHGGIVAVKARHVAVELADAPQHGRGSHNVIDAPTRALR